MTRTVDAILLVNRIGVALLFIAAVFSCWNAASGSFQATIAPAPSISGITPVSCVVAWPLYPHFDDSTHYQVRLNGALYGSSTKDTTMTVVALRPGYTNSIDYVTYHRGRMLGISSPTWVLQCPEAPTGVSASEITSTSFRLSWGDVPTADEYLVLVDGYPSQTVASPAHQIRLDGFLPGILVTVRVRARNPSGYSYDSAPLTVRLLPPAPVQISVSEIGQTTFRLSWLPSTGVSTYTVFRDNVSIAELGSETLTLLVASCSAGATHTARVQARNANGASELSTETTVLMIPATPIQPQITAVSSQSFTVSWTPVAWVVGYKIWRDAEWQIGNVPWNTTSATFRRGFDPGNAASITVSAYNRTGDSPQSPGVYVVLTDAASGTASFTAWLLPEGIDARAWAPGSDLSALVLSTIGSEREAVRTLTVDGRPTVFLVWNMGDQILHQTMISIYADLYAEFQPAGLRCEAISSVAMPEPRLFLVGGQGVVAGVQTLATREAARQAILQTFGRELPLRSLMPELHNDLQRFDNLHQRRD